MKAEVIKRFKCKLDHKRYRPGDIYTGDPDRLIFLQGLGHLGATIEEATKALAEENTEPVHIGGGWYGLPGGERIKGKEEALKALGGE